MSSAIIDLDLMLWL